MQTVKWSFTPGLAATLATALLLPLLLTLGFWQLNRAAEKQALFDDYIARTSARPLDLNAVIPSPPPADTLLWKRAELRGEYADAGTFLLDNQILNGVPGYFVYSLFEAEDTGKRVVINRGWAAAGIYREQVPAIPGQAGRVTLTGTVTAFPAPPGIQLAGVDQNLERMAPGVYRMQAISQQHLEQVVGGPVFGQILRLDPASPTGLLREWLEPGSGKERHLGYAFQWFSLAAALLIIYVSVNLKRVKIE